jgi:hypothetical protein
VKAEEDQRGEERRGGNADHSGGDDGEEMGAADELAVAAFLERDGPGHVPALALAAGVPFTEEADAENRAHRDMG